MTHLVLALWGGLYRTLFGRRCLVKTDLARKPSTIRPGERLVTQWRCATGRSNLGRAGALAESPERGDVPGWVLVTLMTALLVAGLLAFAGPALMDLLHKAMADLQSPF